MNHSLPELLARAKAAYDAMPPDERERMWKAQRRSWVINEMLIDHPERKQKDVEEMYDRMLAEGRLS